MKVTPTSPSVILTGPLANPVFAANDGAGDPLQFDLGSAVYTAQCPPANDVRPRPSIFDPAAYELGHNPWQEAWAKAFEEAVSQPYTLYPLTGAFSIHHLSLLYKSLRWIKTLDRRLTLESLKPEANRSRAVLDILNTLSPHQRHLFDRVYSELQKEQRLFTDEHIVPYLEHHELEEGLFSLPADFSQPSSSPDTAFLAFQNLVMSLYGRSIPRGCIPRDHYPLHFYLKALSRLHCNGAPEVRFHFSFYEGMGLAQLGRTWKNTKTNHARRYLIAIVHENNRWRYVFVSHTQTCYGTQKPYQEIHLFDPTHPTQPHVKMPLTKFAQQWGQAFMQCYMVTVQRNR